MVPEILCGIIQAWEWIIQLINAQTKKNKHMEDSISLNIDFIIDGKYMASFT